MLVVREQDATPLRARLAESGGTIAECTIETQFDRYVGFRGFSTLDQAPQSGIFRLAKADGELFHIEYYATDFLRWLTQNYDVGGLKYESVETDGIHAPSNAGLPRFRLLTDLD